MTNHLSLNRFQKFAVTNLSTENKGIASFRDNTLASLASDDSFIVSSRGVLKIDHNTLGKYLQHRVFDDRLFITATKGVFELLPDGSLNILSPQPSKILDYKTIDGTAGITIAYSDKTEFYSFKDDQTRLLTNTETIYANAKFLPDLSFFTPEEQLTLANRHDDAKKYIKVSGKVFIVYPERIVILDRQATYELPELCGVSCKLFLHDNNILAVDQTWQLLFSSETKSFGALYNFDQSYTLSRSKPVFLDDCGRLWLAGHNFVKSFNWVKR